MFDFSITKKNLFALGIASSVAVASVVLLGLAAHTALITDYGIAALTDMYNSSIEYALKNGYCPIDILFTFYEDGDVITDIITSDVSKIFVYTNDIVDSSVMEAVQQPFKTMNFQMPMTLSYTDLSAKLIEERNAELSLVTAFSVTLGLIAIAGVIAFIANRYCSKGQMEEYLNQYNNFTCFLH